MKVNFLLISLLLINFSTEDISAIEVDLAASQTLAPGASVSIKVTVTATGGASDATMTVSSIALSLVKTDDATKTSAVTCTPNPKVTINSATPVEFTCTAASLTTEGTYKLDTKTITMKDGADTPAAFAADNVAAPTVKASGNTLTISASAAANAGGNNNNNNNNNNSNGNSFLKVPYFLMAIILFF